MKNTMYFKTQEELENYFGGPENIPSNVLAIVGEPTGDEPAEYVLYTVSNNQSISGTMQEQGGYITDPTDHDKIVQLQEDVAYLDENKADKTQLADYVSYSYLSEQDYASETYVADYVSQHAPTPDLSAYVTKTELSNASYATTSYVQDKIDAIPTVDLTGYATEAYVTNKIGDIINSAPETLDTLEELASALGDDPNFATTISTQLGQKANSSDVYTKAEIQAMGYISSIPSEYVTDSELSAMGYITAQDVPTPDLSAYVTKTELSNAGYLTSVPSEYVTEAEIQSMGYITINDVPTVDLSAYVTKTELNNASYATTNDLNDYLSRTSGGSMTGNIIFAYSYGIYQENINGQVANINTIYPSYAYVSENYPTYAYITSVVGTLNSMAEAILGE